MTGPPLRLLLVDDNLPLRLKIRRLLEGEFPTAEFAEVGSAEDAVAIASPDLHSVILLDVRLPGRSGLMMLPELRRKVPDMPIVVVTAAAEDPYSQFAIRAGANAFVSKMRVYDELAAVVRRVTLVPGD